jgi:hypothetical protein
VRRGATVDDFWAIPEPERFHEFLGGELIEKAHPSAGRVAADPAAGGLRPKSKCFSKRARSCGPTFSAGAESAALNDRRPASPKGSGRKRDRWALP